MAQNTTIALTARSWTQLTDADVTGMVNDTLSGRGIMFGAA